MGFGVLLVLSETGVIVVKVVEGVSGIERDIEDAPIPHRQTEGTLVKEKQPTEKNKSAR